MPTPRTGRGARTVREAPQPEHAAIGSLSPKGSSRDALATLHSEAAPSSCGVGLLALQGTAGNRAVARLLRSQREARPLRLQPKLMVGSGNDPLEREADRVAELVMRTWSSRSANACAEEGVEVPIQRLADPGHDPASAFQADDSVAKRLAARSGGGQVLPAVVRNRMEAGFGTDFSSVRIHRDTEAADLSTGLAARAFTHGTDIYFAAGAYEPESRSGRRLLAHELTHVVQQGGAPVHRKPEPRPAELRNGIPDTGRKDGQAVRAHEVTHTVQHAASRTVQRVEIGERPFADAYSTLIKDPAWHEETAAFERRLGTYAYNHPRAMAAVQHSIGRMATVLAKYYDSQFADIDDLWRAAFFKDQADSAGQVGTHLTGEEQSDLLFGGMGNLRELMTAFYNAAYFKSGYGEDNPGTSLKHILHQITLHDRWDVAKDLGLEERLLRERSAALLSMARVLKDRAVKLVVPEDKAHIFSRDIFALGELAGSVQNAIALGKSQIPRSDRTKHEWEQGPEKRTPRSYADVGAPLSPYESFHMEVEGLPLKVQGVRVEEVEWEDWDLNGEGMPQLSKADQEKGVTLEVVYNRDAAGKIERYGDGSPSIDKVFKLIPEEHEIADRRGGDLAPGFEGPEFPLHWVEGAAWFKMDPHSAWYKDVRDRLGVEVIAGVSGTTTRMLSAFRWLSVPGVDPLDFRLALLGWMLTSRDHSLYEILRGAQFAGVSGGEDTGDAARMYMNVAPLTQSELRDHVCTDRMFPHERMYFLKTVEGAEDIAAVQAGTKTIGETRGFKEPGEDLLGVAAERQTELVEVDQGLRVASPELTDWLAASGTTEREMAERLTSAHLVALAGYTGGVHALLNAVMTMPAPVAKGVLRSKLSTVLSYMAEVTHLEMIPTELARKHTSEEAERLKYLQTHVEEGSSTLDLLGPSDTIVNAVADPKKSAEERARELKAYKAKIARLVDPLYEELKVHANMTVEALGLLPPVAGTRVYRGDWKATVSWTYGSKDMTVSQLMSTTTDRGVAEDFATRYEDKRFAHPVLLEMHLNGKGGRNIGFLSAIQDEEEILLMPGTKFAVQSTRTENDVEIMVLTEK